MIWAMAAFSFVCGLFGIWYFRTAFVLYFSIVAAIAIAVFETFFVRDLWLAVAAAAATIVAVQAGVVMSVVLAAALGKQIQRSVPNVSVQIPEQSNPPKLQAVKKLSIRALVLGIRGR